MERIRFRKTLAVLLALALAAGLLPAAFANILDNNPEGTTVDIIAPGDFMQSNFGTVGIFDNEGHPFDNYGNFGTVTTNSGGTITVNQQDAVVEKNEGKILTNIGTVGISKDALPESDVQGPPPVGNFGEIIVNNGTVHFNKGRIGALDGETRDLVAGTGNFGNVEINGGGLITINYPDALVGNNHGKLIVNNGTVNENFAVIEENNNELGLNGQEIFDDGSNIGTVNVNRGIVHENLSVIVRNAKTDNGPGVVELNGETGSVERNEGVIVTNQGTVGFEMPPLEDGSQQVGPPQMGNYGTIVVNGENGLVLFNQNTGIIGGFDENGEPIPDLGNFGTVERNGGGTITINQEDAIVKDNHGRLVINNGTVDENYRSIRENNNTVTLNGHQVFDDGAAENLGVINVNNQTVVTNQGIIGNNRGDVTTNEGFIPANNGKISENITKTFTFLDNGEKTTAPGVETNNGTIESSSGSVATNAGFIGLVDNKGLMASGNTGEINVNEEAGIVFNLTNGIVRTNNGTVYNFGGTVLENIGTHYFSLEIVNETTYTTSAYGDGFVTAYNQHWIGQTGNTVTRATVTLTPAAGYEIKAVQISGKLISAVKDDATGVWTLTFESGANTVYEVPESTAVVTGTDDSADPVVPGEGDNNNPDPVIPTIPVDQFISGGNVTNIYNTGNVVDNQDVVVVTAGDAAGNEVTVTYTVETPQAAAADGAPEAPQGTAAAGAEGTVVKVNHTETTPEGADTSTVTTATVTLSEVLTTGTESEAFQAAVDETSETYNEAFAEAAQSALTISSGTVDFGGAFENSDATSVELPVTVANAKEGQEYTVVLSNGDTITVKCEEDGKLVIPFPADASELSYVIQDDFATRYADLIQNYLSYGDQALAGRSAATQERVKAYAEELKKSHL